MIAEAASLDVKTENHAVCHISIIMFSLEPLVKIYFTTRKWKSGFRLLGSSGIEDAIRIWIALCRS
jgi:hypothetical protein